MIIDTHVHLNSEKFEGKVESYIKKAHDAGVYKLLVIGFDSDTNARAIEIAKTYGDVYASVGFHPTDAQNIQDSDFELLEKLIKHPKVRAIGECGLDFYWDKDHKEKQFEVLEKHIELSKLYDLPLVIHMRDATEATYELLKKHAPLKGVMHSYSGSAEMATKFIELGLYISLAGPVTFKNAKTPKEVAKTVPLDKLLVETDAPYLTPHPYRGKMNDSSYLPLTVEAIALLRETTANEIAKATTNNAMTLFKLED